MPIMIILSLRSVNVHIKLIQFGKCLHHWSFNIDISSVDVHIKSVTIYMISVDVDTFNTYLRN